MSELEARTTRSFCRVCTSVCGILVDVAVDPSMRVGAVSVPHGHQDANVNLLTSKDDIDLITGMAHYSGIPVSIHPGEGTNETMETAL